MHNLYMTQRHAALCLHKSKSINHADTQHSLPLSSEKLQHLCSLGLAGYSGIKFVLVNLTISRVFSEVWQYQWALQCCCKEWWYIVAWYALWSLLLQHSTCNFCLASQQRQIWDCLFATYFSRRFGHIDSHQPILMRPICTEKWINDAKQLALAHVQLKLLFQEGNTVSHL